MWLALVEILSNATVTIIGTVFQTVTSGDGSYYFQYVPIGSQQAMATKHGYNEVTHTVTIVEDQTTNQNFELSLLPQVTVTGRIVGSDNLSVGLANASISLTGYEPYSATTITVGFSLSPLFMQSILMNIRLQQLAISLQQARS